MPDTPQRTPRLSFAARRAQLLDSALDVLLDSGFGHVTVEAIAKRAGVTRPVVYDTFGDLESLMVALIDRADADASAVLQGILGEDPPADVDPGQFLVDSVLHFLQAVRADPRTWRLVLMPPRGNSPELRDRIRTARRRIAGRVEALLDWGIAQQGGPHGLDHAFLARLIVAVGEDAARLMLAHPRRFPPERLAGAAGDLVRLVPATDSPAPRPLPALELPPPPQQTATATAAAATPGERRKRMPQSERREQLLDITLELLADEGFAALSMEAVARRAGVNRVVIYRSFANLGVLLATLMQREDRRIRATLRGLIPREPAAGSPGAILIEALASLLGAVAAQPETWSVALLRPESAPRALQKIVNRRRAALARRIEPLVRAVISDLPPSAPDHEVEAIARMLLTIGEEQGRLALDDPDYPPERLLRATWDLLGVLRLAGGDA